MLQQPSPADAPVLGLDMMIAGEPVRLLGAGALWVVGQRTLVVSDLHLEKGSAYAARGQMTPPYDTAVTLRHLARLVTALRPDRTIALGDSFHDRGARSRMAAGDVAAVRALTSSCEWIWIEGNHDPAPPDDLGGVRAAQVQAGALTLRHEPAAGAADGEVCGHLHPCASVPGRGRAVRSRCFVSDGSRLVMPAFGAMTGGLNVLDEAFAPLFRSAWAAYVPGRDGVYRITPERLMPDGPKALRSMVQLQRRPNHAAMPPTAEPSRIARKP
jgi:DNA ligase-associated metallophosphoesterase